MDKKHPVLAGANTKTSGNVLSQPVSKIVPAPAPRATAAAADVRLPDSGQGLPKRAKSNEFVWVPKPGGGSGKMDVDDTRDTKTDRVPSSSPPPPCGKYVGSKGESTGSKTDGVRESAAVNEDAVSTFTLLRERHDSVKRRHASDMYVRQTRTAFPVDADWVNGASLASVGATAVPTTMWRLTQVTAGGTPGVFERVGVALKLRKLEIDMMFWGSTYSQYAGASPGTETMGRMVIPKHRIVIVRDKWPRIGAPLWCEVNSTTNQIATSINALMFTYVDTGNNQQQYNSELKQSPLTKGVRYEILVDKVWEPGSDEGSPPFIAVGGPLLYRVWNTKFTVAVPCDGMEQLYAGPLQSDIFTNDLLMFVVRDVTPKEATVINPVDNVQAAYSYKLYTEWQDMQTVTAAGGLPGGNAPSPVSPPAEQPTAAALAAAFAASK